jgi:hypothetical protein
MKKKFFSRAFYSKHILFHCQTNFIVTDHDMISCKQAESKEDGNPAKVLVLPSPLAVYYRNPYGCLRYNLLCIKVPIRDLLQKLSYTGIFYETFCPSH